MRAEAPSPTSTVSTQYGNLGQWMINSKNQIADWVGDFVNTHYKPAPRKKVRRNDPLAQDRGPA